MSGERDTIEALTAAIGALAGPGQRAVVAVAGAPGSGKSTLASRLAEALNEAAPDSAAVLPMDGYHYDDLVLVPRGLRARKGAPETFDVAGFGHMLRRLKANEEPEIAVPVFDRAIEIARAGARMIPRSVRFVIAEGNYLLLDEDRWRDLHGCYDMTVMIDEPEAVLRQRLEKRWRDLPLGERRAKIEGNDLPNGRRVMTGSIAADYTLSPAAPPAGRPPS
ncbi:nucleoside/nucleotide kinase family protein [Nitratireductor sp. ZSWI3]|uniref:nucleoside/nucleotide kinase family protein n=1 Tax=Nitratireductor sp. ZSWI3 TaxID=2966359 RepID=UPI00214FA249|nr:nucleoside/nucleotide kinase family protein [Nitratireductor sp. ZSWI3]MCR4267199.1 nucleoside/nucleotide kinase family protein [Nitratireductor sp. ZSWI3]